MNQNQESTTVNRNSMMQSVDKSPHIRKGVSRKLTDPKGKSGKKLSLMEVKDKQFVFSSRFRRFQRTIFLLFEEPDSSRLAKFLVVYLIICVVISCLKVIAETVDSWTFIQQPFFTFLEYLISISFTLEYFARIFSSTAFGDRLSSFFIQPLNIVDLISVLPLFIEIIFDLTESWVIRTLRLVRIIRMFKFSRYLKGISFLTEGIFTSLTKLSYLAILLLIANLTFATLAYYAEQAAEDTEGRMESLHSLPDAMWWSLVTMTTVGFGDKVPHTVLGKCIAVVTGVTGMLMIAIPVAILGNNFQQLYMANIEKSLIEKRKEEALASTARLTEEQQEIFFMNIRLKLIEDNNKEMTALLGKSDRLYKAVTRDLKVLYRSFNQAAIHGLSVDKVDEDGHSKGRFVEKMMRARQKIKVTNLFQKLVVKKEDDGGAPSPDPADRSPKSSWKLKLESSTRKLVAPAPSPSNSSNTRSRRGSREIQQAKTKSTFRVRSNSLGNENPFIKFRNEELKAVKLKDLNNVLQELDKDNAFVEITKSQEKSKFLSGLGASQRNLSSAHVVSLKQIKKSVTKTPPSAKK
eukprot:TRINITY_DN5269_c0_g2_i1.p1 TRINITY_DN5269_c0_g2~~TRINITY_DN5269_c0_g2_i1.p1  ORF type:complete len:576 (+),score=75.59 TRINITY_DN5269_c0_g2_i1:29-1756(+)